MVKPEVHLCLAPVWPRDSYWSHPCNNRASIEFEGGWFCRRHAPSITLVAEYNQMILERLGLTKEVERE